MRVFFPAVTFSKRRRAVGRAQPYLAKGAAVINVARRATVYFGKAQTACHFNTHTQKRCWCLLLLLLLFIYNGDIYRATIVEAVRVSIEQPAVPGWTTGCCSSSLQGSERYKVLLKINKRCCTALVSHTHTKTHNLFRPPISSLHLQFVKSQLLQVCKQANVTKSTVLIHVKWRTTGSDYLL